MKKLNFAILGAGSIANAMAKTVLGMDSVAPYAVASRDAEKARRFAEQYGFQKAYGSYREMIGDPTVDLVYIATPHSHHAEHMRLCIEGGKNILCEKAFTRTAKEAREVLAYAKQKQIFVTEAIWPRYMPMAKTIQSFCASGKIGAVRALTCNLGYPVAHVERVMEPALAGGALLDVGVYTLTFASIVLEDDIREMTSSAVMNEKGVDAQGSVSLIYANGCAASLFFTVLSPTDRTGAIYGDDGYALVDNINNFQSLRIFDKEHRLVEEILCPPQITGYEYEVQAAVDAIRAGALECQEMPHEKTIRMMELMDDIRHGWGMWYPGEEHD
jgi:predicted dehydrogenase